MKTSSSRPVVVRRATPVVIRAGKMLLLHRHLRTVPPATTIRRRTAK